MTRSTTAACLALFSLPGAAQAAPGDDCTKLRNAAAEYSRLADHLTALRREADTSANDPNRLPWIQHSIAQQSREVAGVLEKLQGNLVKPDLKALYETDAASFREYADAVDKVVAKGDDSDVRDALGRNIEAVNAANNAFHAECAR